MDLTRATKIIDIGLDVAKVNRLKPLTICVLDAGGHLIAFKKEDGSSLFREGIARGKALGALGLGLDSVDISKMAAARPMFMQSMFAASGGGVVPVPGGVIVRDHQGHIVGAVGASGDLSEADEACCIAGIRAAGLSCNAIKEDRDCYLKAHL